MSNTTDASRDTLSAEEVIELAKSVRYEILGCRRCAANGDDHEHAMRLTRRGWIALSDAALRTASLEAVLRTYVVAQGRMRDKWAEGDENVKRDFWRNLHACEEAARNILAESADRIDRLKAALQDALAFIEPFSDVTDYGEGKQGPNRAMSLAQEGRRLLEEGE